MATAPTPAPAPSAAATAAPEVGASTATGTATVTATETQQPATQPSTSLPVDPDWEDDENDSTFGDNASSTTSISASIFNYRKLHGRTYQNFSTGTEYWGPNDDAQNETVDLTHHMLYLAMDNKLFMAPIGDNPQTVIDIGTGTGIWAMDFADEFPSAEVIGTDLSPIQPSWVPANCKFELDDAQLPWAFPDNHFDFIHIRCLFGSIKDWKFLYSEVFRCLKPGGWFEHFDFSIDVKSDDDSIPEGCPWKQWADLFQSAGDKMGRSFRVIEDDNMLGWFKEAGFSNLDYHRLKLPFGGWPADPKWKEIGLFNSLLCDQGVEGYVMYMLINVHGWEYLEVQALLGKVRQALRDKSIHAYHEALCAWAQKPLSTTSADPDE